MNRTNKLKCKKELLDILPLLKSADIESQKLGISLIKTNQFVVKYLEDSTNISAFHKFLTGTELPNNNRAIEFKFNALSKTRSWVNKALSINPGKFRAIEALIIYILFLTQYCKYGNSNS